MKSLDQPLRKQRRHQLLQTARSKRYRLTSRETLGRCFLSVAESGTPALEHNTKTLRRMLVSHR